MEGKTWRVGYYDSLFMFGMFRFADNLVGRLLAVVIVAFDAFTNCDKSRQDKEKIMSEGIF